MEQWRDRQKYEQREENELASLRNEIATYQLDRENETLKHNLLEKIRERTLFLDKKEFAKRARENHREDPFPMEEYLGFHDGTTERPIINRDACPEEYMPFILTHETVEVLEAYPSAEERNKWKKEHGTAHPQTAVSSHEEALRAEYAHAQRAGKIREHHEYMVSYLKTLEHSITDADKKEQTRDLIRQEFERRTKIYDEITKTLS